MLAALLMFMSSASLVSAGKPDTVDPALMTPPLNPTFTWECWRTGTGIVCDGERTLSYTAVEALPCDDGWIYITGTDSRTLRRVGDADGRALYTLEKVRITDQLSRSPTFDGIVVDARASWTDRYEYHVPGELSSRTVTRRGIDVLLTIPGYGVVVQEVGISSWDIEGNLLFAHGPHDLLEDFEAALRAACDALAGVSS